MHRAGKLNILEPWEHGTEKSIKINLIKKNGDNYLIQLEKPHKINGHDFHYFIIRPRGERDLDISKLKGTYPVEMGYDKNLSMENFDKYNLELFRGNFLFAELIF